MKSFNDRSGTYALRIGTSLAQIDQRIADIRNRLADAERRYQPLISSPEERTLWQDVERTRDGYIATHHELLKLSRQGEPSFKEAVAYFRGPSRKAYGIYMEAIGRASGFNAKGAQRSGDNSESTYASARNATLALLAAAMASCILLTWLLLRHTRKVLGGDTASLMAVMRDMQRSLTGIVSQVQTSSDGIACQTNILALNAAVEAAKGWRPVRRGRAPCRAAGPGCARRPSAARCARTRW